MSSTCSFLVLGTSGRGKCVVLWCLLLCSYGVVSVISSDWSTAVSRYILCLAFLCVLLCSCGYFVLFCITVTCVFFFVITLLPLRVSPHTQPPSEPCSIMLALFCLPPSPRTPTIFSRNYTFAAILLLLSQAEEW